ncbi:conserved hypothetical protein [Aeropyrum pernix]|uniref:TRAP C4-dicarboxylate transport system permease DctM subunit domain-containing protein n=1 Tax=Aeropyrum pernix TaxID=56636 RepID=A0A401HAR9_AERPX|nr:TRAP transporter permease [Aeropyrum pernix]GBF09460.1 conserved hypothetical protein [Aeropyrum pernix]
MGSDRASEVIRRVIGERDLLGPAAKIVLAVAAFMAFLEVFYVMQFGLVLYRFLESMGLDLPSFYKYPDIFFQLYPAKAIVLSLVIAGAFVIYPISRARGPYDRVPLYDYVLAVIAGLSPFYVVYLYAKYKTVEFTIETLSWLDLAFVLAILVALAEATRRSLGILLPAIMAVFVAYGFIYAYTHPPFGVEGLQVFRRLVTAFISQNQGFLGVPLTVMVYYVFIFLFFSSFLDKLGVGRYITDLMTALFGRKPGGPAKVAVVSSALMGTISGSSVANTLTTGTFTIPAMKRAGFPPEVAGAIEPVASTGGQLMPPIMGAAAFIMAEFVGIPYGMVVIAALLPAILYFYSIYVFVDKESKKRRLKGLPDSELPPLRPLLVRLYYLLPIPLILIGLLRLAPHHAVMAGILATVAVYVIDTILYGDRSARLSNIFILTLLLLLTLVPLVLTPMGLAQSLFFAGGASIVVALVAGLLSGNLRDLAAATVRAVESSFRNSIPVFLAAATASVIQSMITFTNLHKTLGDMLLTLSMGILILLLIATAVFSIILGMGVPTTANYIITATILAGTLAGYLKENLGYAELEATLASHMFVLYYGILADITPPVALAAFVGAVLAGADFWRTAINATIYGFAKYILPFVFVYSPTILIVTVNTWGFEEILRLVYTIAVVLVIIHVASSGFLGWVLDKPLENRLLRAAMVLSSGLSVTLNPLVVALALASYAAALIYTRRSVA